MAASAKQTYHHGELPATLMDLALEHIEAHGTEKLSLRALAREAGVSATAPYRHFATKQCLLAAIATQGFCTLRNEHAAIAAADLDLEERMLKMSLCYVNFAIANPTTYQLMFGSVLGDFSEYEMLNQAVEASYAEVDKLLNELVTTHSLDVDVRQLGGVLWSFLHGISSLLISEMNVGGDDSKPMQAITALRQDHEAALRLLFRDLLRLQ